jgi:predicted kinase
MLCGLTGSGKTVYAKRFETDGCVRLSVDELVHARHGRYDVDYPASDYPRYHDAAVTELDRRLEDLLEAGQSAVLDYGL